MKGGTTGERVADAAERFLRNNSVKLRRHYLPKKTGKLPVLYLSATKLYRRSNMKSQTYQYDLSKQQLQYRVLRALAESPNRAVSGKVLKTVTGSTSVGSVYQAITTLRKNAEFELGLSEELIISGRNKSYRLRYRVVAVDKPRNRGK